MPFRDTGGSDVRSQELGSLPEDERDAIDEDIEEGGKIRRRIWFERHRGTGIDTYHKFEPVLKR